MVSNKGRVKSLRRTVYAQTQSGKIITFEMAGMIRKQMLKPFYNKILRKNFYSLVLQITIEKKTTSLCVSRIVYEAFVKKITLQQKVLHKDEDNLNNTLENLYVGTSTEVNRIAAAQGRTNVPEIFAWQRQHWPSERRKRLQDKTKTKIEVSQYDLQGNYLATYPSVLEAHRKTGCAAIGKNLKSESGITLSGDYLWKQGSFTGKLDITGIQQKIEVSQYDLQGNYRAYKKPNGKQKALPYEKT
jgi:hypothetical protein